MMPRILFSVFFLGTWLGHRSITAFQVKWTPLRLSHGRVFSQVDEGTATDSVDANEGVPYAISRGDGSFGGGGLAMPGVSAEEEDLGLRRPKVGADMPVGRPSWFRVPGPSQGKSNITL